MEEKTIMYDFTYWNKQYIGGEWIDGSSPTRYENVNPYNGETLSTLQLANRDDIARAYEKAKQSQKAWEQLNPYNRAMVMEKAAALMVERADELIEILIAESGSTRIKASIEAKSAFSMLKEAAKYPFQMNTTVHPSFVVGKENRVYCKPHGVVGIISPSNFPFILSLRAVAPALATGNGVVLKPDSQTYISGGLFLAKLFEDAGLPKGVFNVVVGEIEEIGDTFIEHPVPRLISFTGSTETGRHIAQICGKHLKRLHLELGGNNPFIVLEDANIEKAVQAAVFGAFLHQGQICMSINRIIVHKSRYEEFIRLFAEKVKKLKVGNPAEPDTFIGPLINKNAIPRVLSLIEDAVQQGCRLILEGKAYDQFLEPYILADVRNDMKIAQTELFAPVACILPVESEEEAIEIANDNSYGLSSAVFSGSIEHGVRVAQRIQAGMGHVNDQTVNDEPNIPFGGEKASGYGRFGGNWGLGEFTTTKWVSVQNEPRTFPF